jgi:hypothetical protein
MTTALGDNAAAYQENWKLALSELWSNHQSDFDFLDLLG